MRAQIGLAAITLLFAIVVGGIAQTPPPVDPEPPAQTTLAGLGAAFRSDSAVQVGAAGDLIGFSGSDGSGSQTITLVHAGKMQMAVYHIGRSGEIRLVSSRPIDADFSLMLNATAPLPDQIRQMVGDGE